jgi:hypothetical protein
MHMSLGPTQPSVVQTQGTLSQGVKQPDSEALCSLPSCAVIKLYPLIMITFQSYVQTLVNLKKF